jgi:hypothetical protein
LFVATLETIREESTRSGREDLNLRAVRQAIYWLNTTYDPTSGFATGFSLMKIAR